MAEFDPAASLDTMLRLLAAGLSALALAGCGGSADDVAPPPPPAAPAATGGLSGPSLDGNTISLADFRGTPVFVNVWSSW